MSIVDCNFTNTDGSGPVYIVSSDPYDTIVQAGYVPIDLLTGLGIDYTKYRIFMVQWLDFDSNSHINFFNPFFDEGSGNITLASYF